jgi:hypothetical protein
VTFSQYLRRLATWEERHLPGTNRVAGKFLFVWLAKGALQERPLKELYAVSPFSEPTCRETVRAFEQRHYITLALSDRDKRVTLIVATPKLMIIAERYTALLARDPA